MGCRANRVGAAVQVLEILEVSKNRLDWEMVRHQHHPSYLLVGETDTLYLHHLPPSHHLQLGTDIFYNEELQGFLTLLSVRSEWSVIVL